MAAGVVQVDDQVLGQVVQDTAGGRRDLDERQSDLGGYVAGHQDLGVVDDQQHVGADRLDVHLTYQRLAGCAGASPTAPAGCSGLTVSW